MRLWALMQTFRRKCTIFRLKFLRWTLTMLKTLTRVDVVSVSAETPEAAGGAVSSRPLRTAAQTDL